MIRRAAYLTLLATVFITISSCSPFGFTQPITHWVAYYDDALPASAFKDEDLVIFDRKRHPEFYSGFRSPIYLGYVTLGEAYADEPELSALRKEHSVLYHNSTWNSYAVDLKSTRWRKLVIAQVDDAISQGFDGIMLDTVDSPLQWAKDKSPEQTKEMQEAAVSLIHEIRQKYPTIKIMLNRGWDILPQAAQYINFSLAESILAEKDNSSGQFRLFPPIRYAKAVTQLQQIVARAEHLQQFTLDYWDVDDVNGLERIYATQRASGFIPYVTTQDLRHFTPEPGRHVPVAARVKD